MENKENKLDEQLTVTDNLIEAENAEFTENRFLIGEYSFIIQCNSSVIGHICAPPRRGPNGKALLRKSFFKFIYICEAELRGTDTRFNL